MSSRPPISRLTADLLLLVAAIIWGITFVVQQEGMKFVSAYTFTGVRFLLGALCILPIVFWERKTRAQKQQQSPSKNIDIWWAVCLGVILFIAAQTQQVGIGLTSITRSGFITSLYVPMVPLIAWLFFRIKLQYYALFSILLCMIGVVCITEVFVEKPLIVKTLTSNIFLGMNEGDFWTLFSVIFWALHITILGKALHNLVAPFQMAIIQFIVCGVLGIFFAVLQEPLIENLTNGVIETAAPYLLFAGVLSVGVAFTMQIFAQQYTPETDAAIVISAESIFAAIAAYWFINEPFGFWQWVGGTLIFIGILWVQLAPKFIQKR